jgi:hypothetical protein
MVSSCGGLAVVFNGGFGGLQVFNESKVLTATLSSSLTCAF